MGGARTVAASFVARAARRICRPRRQLLRAAMSRRPARAERARRPRRHPRVHGRRQPADGAGRRRGVVDGVARPPTVLARAYVEDVRRPPGDRGWSAQSRARARGRRVGRDRDLLDRRGPGAGAAGGRRCSSRSTPHPSPMRRCSTRADSGRRGPRSGPRSQSATSSRWLPPCPRRWSTRSPPPEPRPTFAPSSSRPRRCSTT